MIENEGKNGSKSVKFDSDTPKPTRVKVDEGKRKDGVKRVSFTTR